MQTERPIYFYSDKDKFCLGIIDLLKQNPYLSGSLTWHNISVNKNIPASVKTVPTILHNGRIYNGVNAFTWINDQIKHINDQQQNHQRGAVPGGQQGGQQGISGQYGARGPQMPQMPQMPPQVPQAPVNPGDIMNQAMGGIEGHCIGGMCEGVDLEDFESTAVGVNHNIPNNFRNNKPWVYAKIEELDVPGVNPGAHYQQRVVTQTQGMPQGMPNVQQMPQNAPQYNANVYQ